MGNSRVVATMKMTMRLEGGGGKDRDYIAVAGTIKSCLIPVLQYGGVVVITLTQEKTLAGERRMVEEEVPTAICRPG